MKLKIQFLAVTTESNVDRKWLLTFENICLTCGARVGRRHHLGLCVEVNKPLKKIVKLQWSLQEWGRPLNTAGWRKLFEAVASHCFRLEAQKRSLRRPLSESTLVSVAVTVSSCLLLSTADCAAGALAVSCVLLPCKLQSSILDNLNWVKWRVLLVLYD